MNWRIQLFFLKSKIINKIETRIMEYCYHELKKVEVEPKHGLFNYRCFENAADYASRFPRTEVIMGFYRHNAETHTSLHFWCRRDGKDFDVTIGYQASMFSYHEIKVIKESDWLIVGSVFNDGLDYYRGKFTSPLERFLINYDRIV